MHEGLSGACTTALVTNQSPASAKPAAASSTLPQTVGSHRPAAVAVEAPLCRCVFSGPSACLPLSADVSSCRLAALISPMSHPTATESFGRQLL